jgi:F-type H+-transporting ATPase subunit alpha
VASIFAGVRGHLDTVPVNRISDFEKGLLDALRDDGKAILEGIRNEKQISPENEQKLAAFITNYAKTFV